MFSLKGMTISLLPQTWWSNREQTNYQPLPTCEQPKEPELVVIVITPEQQEANKCKKNIDLLIESRETAAEKSRVEMLQIELEGMEFLIDTDVRRLETLENSPPKLFILSDTPEDLIPEKIKIREAKRLEDYGNEVAELRASISTQVEKRAAILRKLSGLPAQEGYVEAIDISKCQGNVYEGEVC